MVTERGIAAKGRLGWNDGNCAVQGKLLMEKLDPAADAPDRSGAVEGGAHLVEEHFQVQSGDAGQISAYQVVECCPGQGPGGSGNSNDVSIAGQGRVANNEHSFKAIAVGLGKDVGSPGEVVSDETKSRHIRHLC